MKIVVSGNVYMLPDIMEVQEKLETKKHKVFPIFEYLDELEEQNEKKKEKNRLSFFDKLKKRAQELYQWQFFSGNGLCACAW